MKLGELLNLIGDKWALISICEVNDGINEILESSVREAMKHTDLLDRKIKEIHISSGEVFIE